jgi:tetratricopeptide (TPR) repeat protein
MSYINDALKKAQQERDSRYERFGRIISPGPGRVVRRRAGRFARGAAVVLFVAIPAGLLAFYLLRQPAPALKGGAAAIGRGAPATLASRDGKAAEELARPEEKVTTPVTEAPAGVTPGGNATPADVEALYKEALAAQRRGDVPGAEALYERVLAIDPRHVRALNNLGVICMGQKKRDRAIAFLNKAIVLKRDYVDPYYNLACLYAQTSEIDESLRYLNVAMVLNGDVKNWAEKDADMKNVVESAAFKKMMEGQKN